MEGMACLGRTIPVALRDTRPTNQNLALLLIRQRHSCFRIDDDDLVIADY